MLSTTDRAMHSDSTVLVAMVDCNLDTHKTRHPASSIMYPVQDLTESGLVANSIDQLLANAASTQTCKVMSVSYTHLTLPTILLV